MFFFLYKTQCLVDGSAYFNVQASRDLNWNENNQIVGQGLKLVEKIKRHGKDKFRTTIELCSTERDLVMKRLNEILSPETLANPLCLNGIVGAPPNDDEASHKKSLARLGKPSAATGHVKSEESKAALSERNKALKMKWIHNPVTGEEMQMPMDEIAECGIITGFIMGRASAEIRKKFKQQS
jgi:hypothetical protein